MAERLRADDLVTGMRGGHLLTVAVSQRLAARAGAALGNRGVSPNAISVANMVVGASTAVLMILALGHSRIAAAVIAFVGWQLAYVLDCADGQLARARGLGSPEGIVVDMLCDFVTQLSVPIGVACAATASLPEGVAGIGLVGGIVGACIANLFVIALYTNSPEPFAVAPSSSLLTGVVRMVARDYPAEVLILCVCVAIGSGASLVAVSAYALVNVAFLLKMIITLTARRRQHLRDLELGGIID